MLRAEGFLGANVDAFAEAASLGVPRAASANYAPTADGVKGAFSSVSLAAKSYRSGGGYGL